MRCRAATGRGRSEKTGASKDTVDPSCGGIWGSPGASNRSIGKKYGAVGTLSCLGELASIVCSSLASRNPNSFDIDEADVEEHVTDARTIGDPDDGRVVNRVVGGTAGDAVEIEPSYWIITDGLRLEAAALEQEGTGAHRRYLLQRKRGCRRW